MEYLVAIFEQQRTHTGYPRQSCDGNLWICKSAVLKGVNGGSKRWEVGEVTVRSI